MKADDLKLELMKWIAQISDSELLQELSSLRDQYTASTDDNPGSILAEEQILFQRSINSDVGIIPSDEQQREVNKRIAAYRKNPENVLTWEEVKANVLQ